VLHWSLKQQTKLESVLNKGQNGPAVQGNDVAGLEAAKDA